MLRLSNSREVVTKRDTETQGAKQGLEECQPGRWAAGACRAGTMQEGLQVLAPAQICWGTVWFLCCRGWNPKVSQKNHLLQSVWSENVSVSSSAETDGFQLLVPERETAKGHGN